MGSVDQPESIFVIRSVKLSFGDVRLFRLTRVLNNHVDVLARRQILKLWR